MISSATAAPCPPGHAPHVRDHRSVFAAAEKRLLVWLAARLPLAITADHLTATGALAMAGAGAAFAAAAAAPAALWLVPVMLALNWFGDSLDGTVARVRGQQRPRYGYYLDHVIDLVNATMLFAGMAWSGLMFPPLGLGLLIAYVLLCAEAFLATHALGVFRLSFGGFGPTELRLLLAIGAIAAMTHPVVAPFGLPPVRLFDLGGGIALTGMAIAFVVSSCRNARVLSRLEPRPTRGAGEAPRDSGASRA